MTVLSGEAQMLPQLTSWLTRTGRLRHATQVAYELPWLGRRVDVALITAGGATTAFELKIGNIHRALEQAAYNRASFDRSWIVTGNRPRADAVEWGRQLGIGIVVALGSEIAIAVPATRQKPDPSAAKRLRGIIKDRAVQVHDAAF
jgi:hypothetical protein